MPQNGTEGEPTSIIPIVPKPPDGDLDATTGYWRPYYVLAEHAWLVGLSARELRAVAVLRDGATFTDLKRVSEGVKKTAQAGFSGLTGAWARAFEPLVGIREDAARDFDQKLKTAHFDNRNARRG